MTPDVNVLVAASRTDHPHHAVASAWLNGALASANRGAPVRLLPMVIASFLRLVTHPRIFVHPTPIAEAIKFIDALLETAGVDMPAIGQEWPVWRQICLDRKLSDNDLPDAWLAGAVLHLGEHLVTFDADFRKLLKRSQFTLLKA